MKKRIKQEEYVSLERLSLYLPKLTYPVLCNLVKRKDFPKSRKMENKAAFGGYSCKYSLAEVREWAEQNDFRNTLDWEMAKSFFLRPFLSKETEKLC